MGYLELLRERIDSRELPVCWDWAYVLQGEGLGELLAEQESIKCDYFLVNLDDWLCAKRLNAEDGWIWIVFQQADDLVLEESGLRPPFPSSVLGSVNTRESDGGAAGVVL